MRIFYSHANKPHFHKNGFAVIPVLTESFGTRKRLVTLLPDTYQGMLLFLNWCLAIICNVHVVSILSSKSNWRLVCNMFLITPF